MVPGGSEPRFISIRYAKKQHFSTTKRSKRMDKITAETTVKYDELAVVLGLSGRRIRQMVEDGILTRVDGEINLANAVQTYIKQAQRSFTDEDKKIEQAKRKAEATLKASKAQVTKLEADELAGKMHRQDDVEAVMDDMVYTIRDALMALPGRLAVDCAAASTPAEASTVIRKEVFKVMTELSNYEYDAEKFEERVRNRMEWTLDVDDDD